MFKNKSLVRVLANSILGLVLILVWSRFVNLGELFGILKTAQLKLASSFFLFFFISGLLRSTRLRLLLGKYPLPLKDVLMLNFLSQLLSFMVPLRLGEISKSVYFTSQFELPLAKTVVWIFIDRFLDFWVVLLVISLLLPYFPSLPQALVKAAPILLVTFSLAAILAVRSERLLKKVTAFLSNYLIFSDIKKGFVSFTHSVIEGFGILRKNPLELLALLALTVAATVSDSLMWFFVFRSFGINLGFLKTVLGNSLTALTFLVPAAPGYVGSAEAAGLAVFSGILGLGANQTSAATILYHIMTIIALPSFGVLSLYLLKFDLSLVWKKLRRQ